MRLSMAQVLTLAAVAVLGLVMVARALPA